MMISSFSVSDWEIDVWSSGRDRSAYARTALIVALHEPMPDYSRTQLTTIKKSRKTLNINSSKGRTEAYRRIIFTGKAVMHWHTNDLYII